MTDQQNYTPDEPHFRDYYIGGRSEYDPDDPGDETSREDWDEWLARVRAEAAREALDGLILHADDHARRKRREGDGDGDWNYLSVQNVAAHYRDTHYPEDVTP